MTCKEPEVRCFSIHCCRVYTYVNLEPLLYMKGHKNYFYRAQLKLLGILMQVLIIMYKNNTTVRPTACSTHLVNVKRHSVVGFWTLAHVPHGQHACLLYTSRCV